MSGDRDPKTGQFIEGNLVRLGMASKGGRKSAYEEIGKAHLLAEAFFNEMDEDAALDVLKSVDALQSRKKRPGQKKRGISLFKVALAQALAGNEKLMTAFIKKMFPDRVIDETPQGKSPAAQILEAILAKPSNKKTAKVSRKPKRGKRPPLKKSSNKKAS